MAKESGINSLWNGLAEIKALCIATVKGKTFLTLCAPLKRVRGLSEPQTLAESIRIRSTGIFSMFGVAPPAVENGAAADERDVSNRAGRKAKDDRTMPRSWRY